MTDDQGLFSPGLHGTAGVADDVALVAAMLQVEVAWLRALAAVRAADWRVDLASLSRQTETAGTPLVTFVRSLRSAVEDDQQRSTVNASSQGAELVTGLEADAAAMKARADAADDELLAERGEPGDPWTYLGAASQFLDAVLARVPERGPGHG